MNLLAYQVVDDRLGRVSWNVLDGRGAKTIPDSCVIELNLNQMVWCKIEFPDEAHNQLFFLKKSTTGDSQVGVATFLSSVDGVRDNSGDRDGKGIFVQFHME